MMLEESSKKGLEWLGEFMSMEEGMHLQALVGCPLQGATEHDIRIQEADIFLPPVRKSRV